MQRTSGNFFIGAIINGTTINGMLRSTLPLVQRYTSESGVFYPDFESLAENARPVVYPFLRLTTDGSVVAPSVYKWYYNEVELTFDPTTKLSTTGNMAGVFKQIDYNVTVGSKNYTVPAIRIVKNLVPISGFDNDIIYMSGSIEIGGQQVPFEKLDKTITIEETTGNRYDLELVSDKEFGFNSENESMTVTLKVFKDAVEVTDLSAYNMKWYKVTGDGQVQIPGATTKNITLTTSDVDGTLVIRCDLLKDGGIIASAFESIRDFSDPYFIEAPSQNLAVGETLTITPKVVTKTGQPVAGYTTFKFSIRDNEGSPYKPSKHTGAEFTGASCTLTYEDVIAAKRGINGYVTTN